MSSNKIIQSLWIGKELSKLEQLSIKSFLHNNHDFHLYIYDDVKNVPDGTKVFDANNIVSEKDMFVYKDGWAKGSYSGFADYFRYKLLNENSG